MKTLILVLSLSVVAVGQAGPPPSPIVYTATQAAMSCGSGVIIRADGGVMIDEWKYYESSPGASVQRSYPSSVTLGKSIKDTANVCVEFNNGTLCADVGKLRAFIEANFPVASSKSVSPAKK